MIHFKKLLIFILVIFSVEVVAVTQHNLVIKSGDTLSKHFHTLGVSKSILINLVNSGNNAKYLNNLRIDHRLVISTEHSKFKELRYQINSKKTLVSRLEGKQFFNSIVNHGQSPAIATTKKHITVDSTLSSAFFKVGLSKDHLNTFLDITDSVISPKVIAKGEAFSVYLRNNQIVGVVSKERSWHLWDGLYFDNSGVIISSMFLEAPLKYKRISSGFSYSRLHPILKTYLPHRAVDYAAHKGTKIYAATDGVISFRGYSGALGNTVKITHEHGYETTYAHLWKFRKGVTKGTRVKKGQVIGYVGSTGRSTGNHLHYELRKDGEYTNPLEHKPQLIYKLRGKERVDFLTYVKNL